MRAGDITLATKGMIYTRIRVPLIYIGILAGLICGIEAKHFPGILEFEVQLEPESLIISELEGKYLASGKLESKIIMTGKLETSLVKKGKLEECP